jgi:chorismate synthase
MRRTTNRAGGIEAGVTNGEEVVVRAAMKPLPTLMRPLLTVDLATGRPAEALVERSDVAAVEALAVVAEAVVAWELARAAREKFGGDALADFVAAHRAYVERIPWSPR